MKMDEIREMNDGELRAQLLETQREIMHLRMQNAIGTSESPVSIRHKKRDVARIKTVLRQRESVKQ
ncbi:MAG: 50S ribosomal protein L29 [Acidobacteria bacterium]|nr:50S ribosomal protein L29 [Acidobacteriota bacterium]